MDYETICGKWKRPWNTEGRDLRMKKSYSVSSPIWASDDPSLRYHLTVVAGSPSWAWSTHRKMNYCSKLLSFITVSFIVATENRVPVFSMKTTVIAGANTYTHSSCKQLCKCFEDNQYGQEWRLMAISLGRNKESKLKPTFAWFFPWRQCENEGETASIKQYSFWAKLTEKH